MKTLIRLLLLLPVIGFAQNDSIQKVNVTDSLGHKQGHWIYFGKDFSNSGLAPTDTLEEGYYVDNQKTGIWTRYGSQAQIQAVMLFHIDPRTKTAVRDQFYNYAYHANGRLKYKPVIGACRTMSDYFQYDESGNLIDAELFDSICNTVYKLQRIRKGEMDSVSIFMLDDEFETQKTESCVPENRLHFGQTGEFCVDFNHQFFQVGQFTNGLLVTGKEYLFDDMMRIIKVKYFENGKLARTVVRKSA